MIERCLTVEQDGWLSLREALWPGCTAGQHGVEMATFCANPDRFAQFVAYDDARIAIGFAEVSLRRDHVNGTESSPVAFLEGIYVVPGARLQGIARALAQLPQLVPV